ncbi:hypothetical protein RhiJN_15034 [Ceratobasidium sp. AG-Ba]|nr:hypothetical protein RhiJN_15034 [Ceratobasidium sp. AG-Ba]
MPRLLSLAQRALRARRESISDRPYIRDATHRSERQYPCFYCPRVFDCDRWRAQHIALSFKCRQAEALQDTLCMDDDVRFAMVSEPEPEQEPQCTMRRGTRRRSPPALVTPALPSDPSGPEQLPPVYGSASDGPRFSLEYDTVRQVFVERFPDPRAGAPINDEVVPPLDLAAYMAKVGNLANPDYFDTAELLMTTGLTNAGRDAHLQSRLYKGQVPWPNNKKLLGDIDKLPHGPDWMVYDIDLNETAQRAQHKHNSYLFKRSLLATFQDLMANPEHKDFMRYAPQRDWTAED